MNTKSLSGYLIAIGPILMMATWFFIWPALIGEGAEEFASCFETWEEFASIGRKDLNRV